MIRIIRRLFGNSDFWALFGVFCRLASPFLFLPLILKKLPGVDLGAWYLSGSITIFAGFIDGAVVTSVGRAAGHLYGGAKKLIGHGVISGDSGEPNVAELERMIPTCRTISVGLSLLCLVVSLACGPWVIKELFRDLNDPGKAWTIYLLLVGQMIFTLLSGSAGGIANGLGRQQLMLKRNAFIQLWQMGVGAAALLAGGGVVSLVAVFTIASVIHWIWNELALKGILRELHIPAHWLSFDREIFRALLPNWWRLTISLIGGFLSGQGVTILCVSILGLEAAASWGLSWQAVMAVSSLSGAWMLTVEPKVCRFRGYGHTEGILSLFGGRLKCSLLTYLAGIVGLLLLGPWFIGLLGSHTPLFGRELIILMAIVQLIELEQNAFSMLVLTSNKNPFVAMSLLTGAGIVALGWILGNQWGVVGLIGSRLLVQCAGLAWLPFLLAARSLGLSAKNFVKGIIKVPMIPGGLSGLMRRIFSAA